MITDLDDLFEILETFDITMEQFMLPYILFLDQREHGDDPLPRGHSAVAFIYRYAENVRPWPRASIQELVDKGLLKNYNADETVYPDNLEVTDKFAEAVFATRSDFEQFWDAYPAFGSASKGKPEQLKDVSKEELQDLFEEHIQTKRDFKELIESLHWAMAKEEFAISIDRFLRSEYWKHIQELMSEPPDVRVEVSASSTDGTEPA